MESKRNSVRNYISKKVDDLTIKTEWNDLILSTVETKTFSNESRIITNELDIEKLKQEYFTAGNGIIITDNRPYGMDTVDISVDPVSLINPKFDDLEIRVIELEKTIKALAQYIWNDVNMKQQSQHKPPQPNKYPSHKLS